MATEATLAQYVQRVRGQFIDVDRVFGAQCWDQWSHYATNFLGVPSWPTYTNAGRSTPHGGYACNVYHNARAAGLDRWFEILPATATPRAGDVAFWELGSVWFPLSHVATVLSVPRPGMVRCLTQNPGAVQISDLVTRGVIGYLRPKAGIRYGGTVARTPARRRSAAGPNLMEDLMKIIHTDDPKNYGGKRIWALIGPGFWLTTQDQGQANAWAKVYGPSKEVDPPRFRRWRDDLKRGKA